MKKAHYSVGFFIFNASIAYDNKASIASVYVFLGATPT
jgi:hypothetical protein